MRRGGNFGARCHARKQSNPLTKDASISFEHKISLSYYHDNSRCNVCEKKFKFIKRMKHTCSRCLTTFCHKHGRTSHSNLTSCKVPGNCVCDLCLKLEESEKQKKRERGNKIN